MTVIGPLTTTFRQPASCTTAAPQIYQVFADDKSYNFTQGPLFPASSSCFPSGYNASPTNYYSPGFCPYGYTAACSSLNQVKTETETAVICCPTGNASNKPSYTCPTSSDKQILGCTSSIKSAVAVIGVTVVGADGKTSGYTVRTETSGGITASGIQVRFKSGDPTAGPTSTTDGANSTTSPPTPASTPAQTSGPAFTLPTQLFNSPSSTAAASSSGGVSTAAAIGIGVGSAVAVLVAVISIGTFFYLRWRRRKQQQQQQQQQRQMMIPPPVPPKAKAPSSYRAIPPPYELSEEVSPRLDGHHMSKQGFPRGSVFSGRPAELEAQPPSEASLRDRASPDSQSTGWTDRQARGGVQPMPWI